MLDFLPAHHDLYHTGEYRVSVLGVQMGEATEGVLNFLLRHYYTDRQLMHAVVGEMSRRERL